jgi:hypothetical protein
MQLNEFWRPISCRIIRNSAAIAAISAACGCVTALGFEESWDGASTSNPTTGTNVSWSLSSNWLSAPRPGGGDAVDLPLPAASGPTFPYFSRQGLNQSYSIQYMKIETKSLGSIEANSTTSATPRTLTFTGASSTPLIELFNDPNSGIFNFGEQLSFGELTIALGQSGLGAFKVDSSSATLLIGSPITGSGGISDQGAGTLEIVADTSDANTFTGGF